MDDNKCEGRSLADMTKEQRRAFIESLGSDEARIHWEQCEASGVYNRCPKTDWCAKYQEEKKKQEREQVETLQQRNQLLEDHARQQEAKQKEQEERLKKAEERMEKMASLISQLISSK